MRKKGSALIISLLLMAVISTASFGIARMSFIEIESTSIDLANTKAYYLAEAGIEESLLRWRYQHDTELSNGSRENSKLWQKTDLVTASSSKLTVKNNLFIQNLDYSSEIIGSTIFNKVNKSVGNGADTAEDLVSLFNQNDFSESTYLKDNEELKITKDNKQIFSVFKGNSATDDMRFIWRWQLIAKEGDATPTLAWNKRAKNKFGVEIRMFKKSSNGTEALLGKKIFSPDGDNKIENAETSYCVSTYCDLKNIKSLFATFGTSEETYFTVTPLNCNIVVGAFANTPNTEFTDSTTHIESVGVARGRAKGLEVKLDRNSGRVLGLYDFVIFKGK